MCVIWHVIYLDGTVYQENHLMPTISKDMFTCYRHDVNINKELNSYFECVCAYPQQTSCHDRCAHIGIYVVTYFENFTCDVPSDQVRAKLS